MSGNQFGDQHVRNRKPRPQDQGPPVPPKTLSNSIKRAAAPKPLSLHAHTKPLPSVPSLPLVASVTEEQQAKPLPAPPKDSTLRLTLLWVAAFCIWFLLIVVLLPVITEKDAMPGFNKWLRTLL